VTTLTSRVAELEAELARHEQKSRRAGTPGRNGKPRGKAPSEAGASTGTAMETESAKGSASSDPVTAAADEIVEDCCSSA
jgi:hypothetical protein